MRLLIKIAVPCLLVVVAIYGCVSLIWQNIPVRFRLTLEVKDGDQIRTGSSILEVGYPIVPDSLNMGASSFRRVIGYAVTVDLGEKGPLFLTFINAHRTSKQVIELNKRIFLSAGRSTMFAVHCLRRSWKFVRHLNTQRTEGGT